MDLCKDLSLRSRIATEVDHIKSIRSRPDLRLTWSNLQSACKRCHSAKTLREMRGAGDS
jgi:5-methylcytosine-specific restriction endonuclease McrA